MHATTMKTKRHYTAPVTQRATVELEGGFCGSIMENKGGVQVQGHETGNDYTFDSDPVEGSSGNIFSTSDGGTISWE